MRRMTVMVKSDFLRVVLAAMLAVVLAALLSVGVMMQTAPPAAADDSTCVGFLTGPHDNVIVPPGAVCGLGAARVKGNVKALEDSTLIANFNTIGGNVDGDKAEVVQLNNNTIGGSLQIKEGERRDGPAFLDVLIGRNTLPQGNIQIEKMLGDIIVGNNALEKGNMKIEENTSAGGAEFFVGLNVPVGQNLQVFKNKGDSPKRVQFNTVRENLQCFENAPPFFGTPNTAQKAEGQCAPGGSLSSSAVAEFEESSATLQDAIQGSQSELEKMIAS